MRRTRGAWRRLLGLSIAGCACSHASAAPLPDFPSPASVPVAQIRAQFDARGTREALDATATVVAHVHDGAGLPVVSECKARLGELARAARHDPLSLSVWYMQARCAQALGRTDLRDASEKAFAALLRDAVAGTPPDNGITPMHVESLADGSAIVWASGETVTFSYFDLSDQRKGLVWRVGLRNSGNGRERHLSFEILARRLALIRDDQLLVFPLMRLLSEREVAERDTKGTVKPPFIPRTLEYLDAYPPEQRAERLKALISDNRLSVAIVLARYCFAKPDAACSTQAVDALLPFAEQRHAEAMVLLAFANANGIGVRVDENAAKALLKDAAKREGVGSAVASFFGTGKWQVAGATPFQRWAYEQVATAADAGERLAAGIALKFVAANPAYESDAARLERWRKQSETVGLAAYASAWCIARAMRSREGPAAVHCAERAAAHDADSAAFLAEAYASGDVPGVAADANLAFRWGVQAGMLGDARAMRMVGLHYAAQSGKPGSRPLAAKWFSSSMMLGDVPAMLDLAEMLSAHATGTAEDAKEAAGLLESVLKVDAAPGLAPRARRDLAELLIAGLGVARDTDRARDMLAQDAGADDARSQLALARAWHEGSFGHVDEQASSRWLEEAVLTKDAKVTVAVADDLYRGVRLAVDRDRALALWAQAGRAGERLGWNNMAWELCTAPEASLRDPTRGFYTALRATVAPASPAWIDTLAACQAATGDFEGAIASEQRVLADADPDSDLAANARRRADLFRQGRAFVQPAYADRAAAASASPEGPAAN